MTDVEPSDAPHCLVAVPIRSFRDPKTRLAGVLSGPERESMARTLALGVVRAIDDGPHADDRFRVAVVTDDDEVEQWALGHGLGTVRPGARGLDAAADAALDHAGSLGATWLAVVHADLAAPAGLLEVLSTATGATRLGTVSAVTDRHADGTNVLVVPANASFRFAYGPGSYARHRAAAAVAGLGFAPIEHDELGWDVDTPAELEWLRARPDWVTPHTSA